MLLSRSFTLPSSVLEGSPNRLFSELRKGVSMIKEEEHFPEAHLFDIGFKRERQQVEVTLFFQVVSTI